MSYRTHFLVSGISTNSMSAHRHSIPGGSLAVRQDEYVQHFLHGETP